MSQERERALGQFVITKKQIYDLGIKAQSLLNDIHEETDPLLSEKDFTDVDFKKIECLAKELQVLQTDFKEKAEKMKKLQDTYGFCE